jgi:hypothetical protein
MRECKIAVALLVAAVSVWAAEPAQPGARKLTLPADAGPITVQGKPGARVIDLAEVDKTWGKKAADELKKLYDPEKEDLVVVRWTTGGPPFGTLEWRVGKESGKIEFYVKEPNVPPGSPRGRALKLGQDFFAVPRGSGVMFGSGA